MEEGEDREEVRTVGSAEDGGRDRLDRVTAGLDEGAGGWRGEEGRQSYLGPGGLMLAMVPFSCIAVILGFQNLFLLFVNQLVSCFISIPVTRMISAFSVSVG